MNTKMPCMLVALAIAFVGGCGGDEGDVSQPTPSPPVVNSTNAVILEWDRLLWQTQGTGTLYSFRQFAILHVAMFDAANSVTLTYKPFRLSIPGSNTASAEAAAAQAGHDVLVSLFPASAAIFDTALSTRLASVPQPSASQGVEVGKQVAVAILQWRANDGAAGPDPAYLPPVLPGVWRPTAPGQVAAGTRFINTLPFALISATQYLPVPPPALNTAVYAQNYQQVYDVGRVDSLVRTTEQTQLARLIAGVNYSPAPNGLWNAVARTLAESRQMSLIDTARMFALMNVSMHDSIQTSHANKYVYGLWRPVTAINNGNDDLNDTTIGDPTWTPLITTPPYPSHSSNVMCLATGASRALSNVLGSDQVPFSVTWTWTGAAGAGADVTSPYTELSTLRRDAGMARVYGGIHFEFEINASEAACTKVADYVFNNYMRPN